MNLIKNNKVTTKDVAMAERVYGPDIGALKGNTTRKKPIPVTSNLIEIPEELLEMQQDIVLSLNDLTVNSLKFLTTISHNIYYCTAQYVMKVEATIFEDCVDEIVGLYQQGAFTVTEIHCDN